MVGVRTQANFSTNRTMATELPSPLVAKKIANPELADFRTDCRTIIATRIHHLLQRVNDRTLLIQGSTWAGRTRFVQMANFEIVHR